MANHHARRLMRHLETLDFYRDHAAEQTTTALAVYRHANDPEQAIKVFDQMSDNSITHAERLAAKIVGLGSSGPAPQTIKERARIHRRKQKTQRQREDQARAERAAEAEAEHQAKASGERRRPTASESEDYAWEQAEVLHEAGFMLGAHGFSKTEQGEALRTLLKRGVRNPATAIKAMTPQQIAALHPSGALPATAGDDAVTQVARACGDLGPAGLERFIRQSA